jgi:hypothetical protein
LRDPSAFVASECPLAGMHILQGMEILAGDEKLPQRSVHPIELVARAYGLVNTFVDDGAQEAAKAEQAARTA